MTISTPTTRVGRKPIAIPSGVDVKLNAQTLLVKGPKGQQTVTLHPYVKVSVSDNKITVQANTENTDQITGASTKLYRSITGTVRSNINNLVQGVATGFERRLLLVGVGYRAQSKGKVLSLSLGFSHPTDFVVPEGITIETPTQTEIVIKGVNKELVGLVAAKIRALRPPEPYKGKGIRYSDEHIEIKETKKK